MSFDRLVRQQRRRSRKSCRLSKTMTRMTIGQFGRSEGVIHRVGVRTSTRENGPTLQAGRHRHEILQPRT